MIYVLLAIIFGLALGMILPVPTNQALSLYFVVGIFSALDSVLGAIRAGLEDKYDSHIFISGFLVNSILAMILAYVGDKLSLPLYYAAIFVFGTRLFSNSSIIRRQLIGYRHKRKSPKDKWAGESKKNRRLLYAGACEKRKRTKKLI